MSEIVFVVEEAPEGGLLARALGASIVTEAEDLAQLRQQVRDAVRCHFDEGRLRRSSACTTCARKSSRREVAS